MAIDPERAQSLFLAALEVPDAAARQTLLDRECADDDALRQRVDALLGAHAATRGFDVEPSGQAIQPPREESANMRPGALVGGRYKLLQSIGEGGMGTVWLAEQKEPIKRKVALKLVKAGMDSRQVLARFDAERQALALMDHPNIAKVFDGGMTEQGRPYFVMEYVKGVPLTEYCDQARLSLKQRLQLFVPICQAVQHAHQKGILHRDLKPSNILICLYDGQPVPKVIDFGLAKALHQSLTEESLFTAHGMLVGTPLYMSPEQAEYNNLDVDTRTDIYSLGVLLYELLTGTTPLERRQMQQAAYNEILRLIKEVDPPKPSTRLSGSAGLPSIAAQRSIDPRQLSKSLVGDLDWIVMKALDKERGRRYETANGLARDLERFLHDEAVEACPPSTAYRLQKFVKRNKARVIAAGLVLLALVAGIVGTSVGLYQANLARIAEAQQRELAEAKGREANDERAKAVAAAEQEREAKERETQRAEGERLAKLAAKAAQQRAEESAAKEQAANAQAQKRLAQVEKGNEVLASIFTDFNINEVNLGAEPLEAVLAKRLVVAAEQLEGESVGDPVMVAQLQIKLGNSLCALGYPQEAVKLIAKAHQTSAAVLGVDHHITLLAMNGLAAAYQHAGDLGRSLPMFEELRKAATAYYGVHHRTTLTAMNNLAHAYAQAGKASMAVPIYQEVLELQTASFGELDAENLICMNNLGAAYKDAGKPDLARPLLEKTLELMKEHLGVAHPYTLNCMLNLAGAYKSLRRPDLAVPLLEEVVALRKAQQGVAHPDTLLSIGNLAGAYGEAGEVGKALTLSEEVLEATQAKLGPMHRLTILAMNNLATIYADAGKSDQSLALLEQTLPLMQKHLGVDHPHTLTTMNNLALSYQDAGQLDKALPLFEENFKLRKNGLGYDHPDALDSMSALAGGYRDAGQLDKALPLLEENHRLRKIHFGPDHHDTLVSMQNLAIVYQESGQYDRALPLFEEMLELAKSNDGPQHPRTLAGMHYLADCYMDADKLDLALPLSEEAFKLRKAQLGSDHPDTLTSMNQLGVCYWRLGQFAKSVPLYEELLAINEQQLGRTHSDTLWTVTNLGVNYKDAGRIDESIPLLEEAYDASNKLPALRWVGTALFEAYTTANKIAEAAKLTGGLIQDARQTLPKASPELASQLAQLGFGLLKMQGYAEAEPLLRESLTIRETKQPDDWTTFNTRSLLGGSLLGQKKFAEAELLLLQGYEGLNAREQTIPPQVAIRIPEALERLVALYTAWHAAEPDKGYDVEAAEWQKKLAQRQAATAADAQASTPE